MHIPPSAIAAPVQTEFGLQMKRARKEARLTQIELANKIGVNPETITRVERGFNTRIETMVKIRQALPSLVLYTDSPTAARATFEREAHLAQQAKTDLTDLQTRIMHLVQAIDSVERLQRAQAYVLKLLTKHHNTLPEEAAPVPAKPTKPAKGKRR